ncbi:MAG: ankyrin repeat domain-containing protein [Thermoguttaceae bacterium]|nr:ankyrin repeat domain-containing protein [Thermoguttaceae bacterium]
MNEENRAAEQETEKRLSPEEAARAGDLATLRYWIEERGFDVNSKSGYYGARRSILCNAIEGQDLATVRYLVEEAGAQVEYGADYVPLVYAARDGAWEIVRYLVEERRVRVEETDYNWGTILHCAARTGDLALTKSVVEKYDAAKLIKYETFRGETPIFYAVESGALDVVRYLVELGSDVNLELDLHYPESCSSDNKRLTHVAAENGFLDILRYLIEEAGADPGPYPGRYDKGTPTSLALEGRHWETARYLLNEVGLPVERWEINGAARGGDLAVFKDCLARRPDYLEGWKDDECKREDIVEALSAAIEVDALDIVRYLIEERGVDVGIKGRHDETAALCAAKTNKPEILRYLVERGADVNAKDGNGETAVLRAVEAGAFEIVRLLVDAGAGLDAKNKNGETPLHFAAKTKSIELVRYLVESGADVNATSYYGTAPLCNAAWGGAPEIVRFLLESGADVNAKDGNGETALHIAARHNNFEAVRVLLELSADVGATNSSGETALLLAARYRGNTETVRCLIELGAVGEATSEECEKALTTAADDDALEIVRLLMKLRSNVDETNANGETALHLVAKMKSAASVLLLCDELGANVCATNNVGETPLHVAAKRGATSTIRVLVALGADVGAKDGEGKTPLHVAAENDASNGAEETVRVLLELGADVAAKDSEGKTPRERVKKERGRWSWTETRLIAANADEPRELRNKAFKDTILRRFDDWGLKQLLEKGNVDLNATDGNGDTALHNVAKNRDGANWGKILLEAGADPTRLNRRGETPLDVASFRACRDALEAPTRERLRAKRLARAERKRKDKR